MKTLLVLAALTTLALAAPSLPTSRYGYRPVQYRTPGLIRRDKKSTQALSDDATPIEETSQQLSGADIESIPEARTFGLKKPIIIKKKLGYHLYRDSEEERAQADPTEKCNKQVRFKFCDAESTAKSSEFMRSSTIENADSDMKQSIKMAKTALENLQKMSHSKHAEEGPDAEMHEDIEIARKALEHIQKNFGNIESMNLRATTLSDAEALQDAQFQIADNDKEKMVQWKAAIENIQKNAEIARNIEDSINSENHATDLSEFDETVTSTQLKHADPEHDEDSHKSFTKDKSTEELEKSPEQNSMLPKNANTEENVQDEMASSASEPKQMRAAMPNNEKSLISEVVDVKVDGVSLPESQSLHSMVAQEKLAEPDNSASVSFGVSEIDNAEQPKASVTTENKLNSENSEAKSIKSIDAQQMFQEDQHTLHRDAHELEKSSSNQNLELEKSNIDDDENKQHLAKSVENPEENKNLESGLNVETQKTAEEVGLSVKAVETPNLNKEAEVTMSNEDIAQQNMKVAENIPFVPKETNNIDHSVMLMKSADHEAQSSQQITNTASPMEPSNVSPTQHEISPELRTADHPTTAQQLQEPSTLNAGEARNWHSDTMPSEKASEQFNFGNPNTGLENNVHNALHNTGLKKNYNLHTHPTSGLNQARSFPRNHEQFMGKSADMDSAILPSMRMNVEADSGKAVQEKHSAVQWKQDQAARGAYGAYGAGLGAAGSGAVGVFPNANVGGCAIPLLLSCSPSVVSGSLASGHGYGGPAYRAGEKFNFHNKRETDKIKRILSPKVKRNPTRIIEKIPYVLDKKL